MGISLGLVGLGDSDPLPIPVPGSVRESDRPSRGGYADHEPVLLLVCEGAGLLGVAGGGGGILHRDGGEGS